MNLSEPTSLFQVVDFQGLFQFFPYKSRRSTFPKKAGTLEPKPGASTNFATLAGWIAAPPLRDAGKEARDYIAVVRGFPSPVLIGMKEGVESPPSPPSGSRCSRLSFGPLDAEPRRI